MIYIFINIKQPPIKCFKNHANFIIYNSLIIYLNPGLFEGSLSQHFFINLTNPSGHFGGIVGLSSRLSTSSDTLAPLILR